MTPEEFADYAALARAKGFLLVSATPLTRSSYHADADFAALRDARAAGSGAATSGHAARAAERQAQQAGRDAPAAGPEAPNPGPEALCQAREAEQVVRQAAPAAR